MEVTNVKIQRILTTGKTRALASVVLNDAFVVHEVRVMEGSGGLFMAMPSRKGDQGDYRDIAHPITAEARKIMQDAVLAAYRETTGQLNAL